MKKLSKNELKNIFGGTKSNGEVGYGCRGIVSCHRDAVAGDYCYDGPDSSGCICRGQRGDLMCG